MHLSQDPEGGTLRVTGQDAEAGRKLTRSGINLGEENLQGRLRLGQAVQDLGF